MEIARIDAAVVLDHQIASAFPHHVATVGRAASHPVDDAVEKPDGDLADVILNPLVKDRAKEPSPLFGGHGKLAEGLLNVLVISHAKVVP